MYENRFHAIIRHYYHKKSLWLTEYDYFSDKNMRIKLQSILQPCLIRSFGILDRITTQYLYLSSQCCVRYLREWISNRNWKFFWLFLKYYSRINNYILICGIPFNVHAYHIFITRIRWQSDRVYVYDPIILCFWIRPLPIEISDCVLSIHPSNWCNIRYTND